MEGPRSPVESEYSRVLEFLDNSLRADKEWSIASEYPTAFHISNIHNIRIITENDRVLSHAVVKPLIVKTPLCILKVAAIGSVVTDEAHRNKGLSQKILNDCIASAQIQNCDFAILWTNLYDFYRKMGFELAGSEISLVVENELEAPTGHLKFMNTNKISAEALHRLYSSHSVTTVRTIEEVKKFLQIPNTICYTAWDSNNQLVAYAIEGKGADLSGYIHEWGGQVSNLMCLFAHIRKVKGQAYTIICPKHSINLIAKMKAQNVLYNEGFLGMIKLINPEVFFNKIIKASKSIGIPDLILQKSGNEFILGAGTQSFRTTSEADVVRLIFGPQLPREIYPFNQEVLAKFERIFPLQMWMWGWDSI